MVTPTGTKGSTLLQIGTYVSVDFSTGINSHLYICGGWMRGFLVVKGDNVMNIYLIRLENFLSKLLLGECTKVA